MRNDAQFSLDSLVVDSFGETPNAESARDAKPEQLKVHSFDPPIEPAKLFSKDEWIRLAHHMGNANPPDLYVLGKGNKDKDSKRCFRCSKTVGYPEAVELSWDSLCTQGEQPVSAVPYCTNEHQQSTWACFDIDAHGGAETDLVAEKRLKALLNTITTHHLSEFEKIPISFIVQLSGGGFHIHLICSEFRSIKNWRTLLRTVLHGAFPDWDLSAKAAIDLYPQIRRDAPEGLRGARLPGTANVKTWDPSNGSYFVPRVLAAFRLRTLLEDLPETPLPSPGDSLALSGLGEELKEIPLSLLKRTKDKPQAPPIAKPLRDHPDAFRILNDYEITEPGTRHGQLASLVGDGAFHFSKEQLWKLAVLLFKQAKQTPSSSLEEHRTEFEDLYEGWEKKMLPPHLNKEEKAKLNELKAPRLRQAFVIAQNFSRNARKNHSFDFPLAGTDLMTRLGIGQNPAYELRKALIEANCMKPTRKGNRRTTADRFQWLLS